MKKNLRKVLVITLLWTILLTAIIVNNIYAKETSLNLTLSANKTSYEIGQEVEIKVKLSEKVMTASFYLNYDSSTLEYKETKTSGLAVKDYPSDNLLRVVYADLSGTGADELIFVFTSKEKSDNSITFSLTNTTMTVSGENESFSQDQISGANSVATIKIENPTADEPQNNPTEPKVDNKDSNTKDDTTVAKTDLPKTGENNALIYLLIAFVLVTVFLGICIRKMSFDFKL